MKSGIYRTPNGNLIYVAKDRTVKATTLRPSSWPGTKVSHRAKDDTVLLADEYRCTRVADVPNGCNDPVKALDDYLASLEGPPDGVTDVYKHMAKTVYDETTAERVAGAPRALGAGYRVSSPLALRAQGYRPCHKQSARKHRRAGHTVIKDGSLYWWKKTA